MISLWLAVLLASPSAAAEMVRLAVYHTNDVHGWIMARPASFYEKDPTRRIGGYPALMALLAKDKTPRLLLDGGDWFQGAPEGTITQGRAVAESMNAAGYDAVVVGNHDFDFAEERLKDLAMMLRPPALGANVYREADGRRVDYLRPYVLKEIAGVKVGVFGLLTANMKHLTFARNIAGLRFRREVDEARDTVRELRAQGATVVIALTHVGLKEETMASFEDDRVLAAEVPGIDLIVGGHTHARLREPARDPKNGTLIVQAGSYLTQVGRAELEIDRATGRVVSSKGELLDLWVDELGEEPAMKALVGRYVEDASRVLDVVVATAVDSLTRNRLGESSLGDWMTDCAKDWAGVDVAFQNSGGIRADMPRGPVTLRGLFEIMPFDNYVTTLSLTGSQIREVLEHGMSGHAGLMQVGGLRFTYEPDAEPGRRVRRVWVGAKLLDDAARYRVATLDFLVKGGDGYSVFNQSPDKHFSETLLRDVLASCARKEPLIRAAPADRITRAGAAP